MMIMMKKITVKVTIIIITIIFLFAIANLFAYVKSKL